MPRVSVVIPVWNGETHLPACLEAIRRQTFRDLEVVAVDNGSTDASREILARFPEVRVLPLPENRGFAGGMNAGFRAARGEFLVGLNQDTRASPRFLAALVAAADSRPDAGMVASKMIYAQDGKTINSAGIVLWRDGSAVDRGCFEPDEGQYDRLEEVFGACGGGCLYKRAMLDEIGIYDEDFFAYFEDVDLAWRARLAGWRCVFAPEAVVYHKHGGSETQRRRRDKPPEQVLYWCERNRIWMLVKNASIGYFLLHAPVLLVREAHTWVDVVINGNRVKLSARRDALRLLGRMFEKRRDVQRLRRVPHRNVQRWMTTPRPRPE